MNLRAFIAIIALFSAPVAKADDQPMGLVLLDNLEMVELGIITPRMMYLTVAPDTDPFNGDRLRVSRVTAIFPSQTYPCPAEDTACAVTKRPIALMLDGAQTATEAMINADLPPEDKAYFLEITSILDAIELTLTKEGDLWLLRANGYQAVKFDEKIEAPVLDLNAKATQRYARMSIEDVESALALIVSFNSPTAEIGGCAMRQLAPIMQGKVSGQDADDLRNAMRLYVEETGSAKLGGTGRLSEMTIGRFPIVAAYEIAIRGQEPADVSAVLAPVAWAFEDNPEIEQYVADRFDMIVSGSRYIARMRKLKDKSFEERAAIICNDILLLEASATSTK